MAGTNVDYTKNAAAIAGKRFMPKVANATFKVNGVPAFVAKSNTDSQVNIQTTQDQIRAGQNNVVIGAVISEKTIDISFSTPEWQIEYLASNVGSIIQVGNFAFCVTDITYPVKNGKITLPEIPADKKIHVDVNGAYVTVPATSTEIDLSAYGVTGDTCVSAICMMNKKGKRVELSTDGEPLVGELTLDSPIFEGTKGKVGTSQYVFPAFALSGNWNHQYSSDTSYEISGTAIATNSDICGQGQSYGYYQEYIDGEDLDNFSSIVAAPSAIELSVGENETITVYGTKGALYEKTEITGATFATADTSVFTVGATDGNVTGVAEGNGAVTVTYNGMTTTVDVEVTSAS